MHAPGGIRTRNPSKLSAVDTRLRPLGHWDPIDVLTVKIQNKVVVRNMFVRKHLRLFERE